MAGDANKVDLTKITLMDIISLCKDTQMYDARKRIALYLSLIVIFIMFYVIVVGMMASISKRVSCSVMSTENMTSHENGRVCACMETLASLVDTIISEREGTYTPTRLEPGVKPFRCENRKSGVNASLTLKTPDIQR